MRSKGSERKESGNLSMRMFNDGRNGIPPRNLLIVVKQIVVGEMLLPKQSVFLNGRNIGEDDGRRIGMKAGQSSEKSLNDGGIVK